MALIAPLALTRRASFADPHYGALRFCNAGLPARQNVSYGPSAAARFIRGGKSVSPATFVAVGYGINGEDLEMVATTSNSTSLARGQRPMAKFPPQVEMILSAIETGEFSRQERRGVCRDPYRTEASLRLFSDAPGTPAWQLYTRDANEKGLGFITAHRLPLGYGGVLELEAPDGNVLSIPCTLLRCREAAPGWFEGSLYFNRIQPALGPAEGEEDSGRA